MEDNFVLVFNAEVWNVEPALEAYARFLIDHNVDEDTAEKILLETEKVIRSAVLEAIQAKKSIKLVFNTSLNSQLCGG